MIGCEFCLRDPEGPSDFCSACLIEQRDELRSAAEDLLHVLTYDRDPRTYSAQWLAAVERMSEVMSATPSEPDA